jgi:CYTH domain-containing protein
MREIERKFLVDPAAWEAVEKPQPLKIAQGYLLTDPKKTVRVRIKGSKGFLTIKGKTQGITRSEFEYEIPLSDAEELLRNFTDKALFKERYEIPYAGKIWEVDVFHGKLNGLVLAEIELQSEDEDFNKPIWATKEVSSDPSYYNAVLIERC